MDGQAADRSRPEANDLDRLDGLQDKVETLPEGLKNVLELFYFNKLDYQSIAARTGLTVGAVGQRLSRARRHLRLA